MTDRAALRIAELQLITPRMGQSMALFLQLWDARGATVSHAALSAVYPAKHIGSTVYKLRHLARNIGWPVDIQNVPGEGYCLSLLDQSWDWETLPLLADPRAQTAAAIMATTPGLPRRAAIVLQVLWSHANTTATHAEIARHFQDVSGRKCSRHVIGEALTEIRSAVARQGWPIRIKSVSGIGYRLTSPKHDAQHVPADLFGAGRHPGV